MRTFIVGGPAYRLTFDDYDALDRARWELPITEVWYWRDYPSGRSIAHWAKTRKIPLRVMPSKRINWDSITATLVFPGKELMASIVDTANKRRMEVWDWRGVRSTFL